MLKSYYVRDQSGQVEVKSPGDSMVADRVPRALSSARADDTPLSVAVTGNLSSSDILENLPAHLAHPTQCAGLIDLVQSNEVDSEH